MSDPIQLCAQADLLLLCCDMLRHPAVAGPRLREAADSLGELLTAAGAEGVALADVFSEARRTDPAAWLEEYHRLFDGAMLCPLNESTYIRRDKGAIIADLRGFYTAFGFSPSPDTGEKPDHLLAQLEYLAMLLVMSAKGDTESRSIALDAIGKLAADHLCDWIAIAWERLALVTSLAYYVSVAEALRGVWMLLSSQLGFPPVAPAALPQAEPEEPYECGMADAAGAVELRVHGRTVEP